MSRSTALAASGGRRADRLAQAAQRLLRVAADARLALGLLLLAGAWNAVAAAIPSGACLLSTPPYLLLLVAHARPDIGVEGIRADNGLARVADELHRASRASRCRAPGSWV